MTDNQKTGGEKMKMSKETAELFGSEFAGARKRGMTYWAISLGLPYMTFGKSEAEARGKAERLAKNIMARAKITGPLPSVQSGELA